VSPDPTNIIFPSTYILQLVIQEAEDFFLLLAQLGFIDIIPRILGS